MTEKAFKQMMSGLKEAKDEYGRTVFPDCSSKYYAVRDAIELLKKQEAIPIAYKENMLTGLPVAICPKCGRFARQFHMDTPGEETKFCPFCGQKVKWE